MTTEQFTNTMEEYNEIIGMAKDVLAKHRIDDVVKINGVKLLEKNAVIEYTHKWDWEFVRDNLTVPIKEFCREN